MDRGGGYPEDIQIDRLAKAGQFSFQLGLRSNISLICFRQLSSLKDTGERCFNFITAVIRQW